MLRVDIGLAAADDVWAEAEGLESSPLGALAGMVVPGVKNVYWCTESS